MKFPNSVAVLCFTNLFWGALCAQSTVVKGETASSAQHRVNIAVVGPLTPSSKAFGIAHLQGITLAVDEYNQQHTASGLEVQLNLFDDKANPELGKNLVKSIASSDAVAILGPANSAVTSAVIQLLQAQIL